MASTARRGEGLTVKPSLLPFGVPVGLVVVYLPAFGHAVEVWRYDREFSFGFLVPPFALALLWLQWPTLRDALSPGRDLGLIPLVFGLLMLVAGSRLDVHALAAASFLPTTLGAVVFLLGTSVARLVLLPGTLMTISLSLYRGLLSSLGFALQGITATLAALLASLLGVPVRQSGVNLFVGGFHFVVTEACSGMDSLLALLCLGLAFAGLARSSLGRRATLIALILPIVLAANVVRVTLVLLLSQWMGLGVANGLFHDLLSVVLFLAATLLFALAGIGLKCAPQLGDRLSPSS